MAAVNGQGAVASAVRRRRRELGFRSFDAISRVSGLSTATWKRLEAGAGGTYRPSTLAAIARALRWPPDALVRISRGEDPAEIPTVDYDVTPGTLEERVLALERAVLALSAQVSALQQKTRHTGHRSG